MAATNSSTPRERDDLHPVIVLHPGRPKPSETHSLLSNTFESNVADLISIRRHRLSTSRSKSSQAVLVASIAIAFDRHTQVDVEPLLFRFSYSRRHRTLLVNGNSERCNDLQVSLVEPREDSFSDLLRSTISKVGSNSPSTLRIFFFAAFSTYNADRTLGFFFVAIDSIRLSLGNSKKRALSLMQQIQPPFQRRSRVIEVASMNSIGWLLRRELRF